MGVWEREADGLCLEPYGMNIKEDRSANLTSHVDTILKRCVRRAVPWRVFRAAVMRRRHPAAAAAPHGQQRPQIAASAAKPPAAAVVMSEGDAMQLRLEAPSLPQSW